MCVLCMFYIDWSREGRKNLRVGFFLNKNLLGKGYRKQTTFFLGLIIVNLTTTHTLHDYGRSDQILTNH